MKLYSSTDSVPEEEQSDDTITVSSSCESDSEFYPSPAKKTCVTPISMGKVFLSVKHLSYNNSLIRLT